jgi:hypothetical protein
MSSSQHGKHKKHLILIELLKETDVRKISLISLVVISLILATGFAIPVLAHGPEGVEIELNDQEAWEAMHEACEEGDWEKMAEVAEEVHGKDFSSMSCHEESYYSPGKGDRVPNSGWGGMGGHMGGDWGGMMRGFSGGRGMTSGSMM